MIPAIVAAVAGIAAEFIPDEDKRIEFKSRLLEKSMDRDSTLFKAQRDIIVAEAQGESWLQRNWRPLIMLVFGFIVANNYIIAPYIAAFAPAGTAAPVLEIPTDMWSLMKLGLGGYVVGRSGEKIAKTMGKGGLKGLVGG